MGSGVFLRFGEGGWRSAALATGLRRMRIFLTLRGGVGYSSSAARFMLDSSVGKVSDLEVRVIEAVLGG